MGGAQARLPRHADGGLQAQQLDPEALRRAGDGGIHPDALSGAQEDARLSAADADGDRRACLSLCGTLLGPRLQGVGELPGDVDVGEAETPGLSLREAPAQLPLQLLAGIPQAQGQRAEVPDGQLPAVLRQDGELRPADALHVLRQKDHLGLLVGGEAAVPVLDVGPDIRVGTLLQDPHAADAAQGQAHGAVDPRARVVLAAAGGEAQVHGLHAPGSLPGVGADVPADDAGGRSRRGFGEAVAPGFGQGAARVRPAAGYEGVSQVQAHLAGGDEGDAGDLRHVALPEFQLHQLPGPQGAAALLGEEIAPRLDLPSAGAVGAVVEGDRHVVDAVFQPGLRHFRPQLEAKELPLGVGADEGRLRAVLQPGDGPQLVGLHREAAAHPLHEAAGDAASRGEAGFEADGIQLHEPGRGEPLQVEHGLPVRRGLVHPGGILHDRIGCGGIADADRQVIAVDPNAGEGGGIDDEIEAVVPPGGQRRDQGLGLKEGGVGPHLLRGEVHRDGRACAPLRAGDVELLGILGLAGAVAAGDGQQLLSLRVFHGVFPGHVQDAPSLSPDEAHVHVGDVPDGVHAAPGIELEVQDLLQPVQGQDESVGMVRAEHIVRVAHRLPGGEDAVVLDGGILGGPVVEGVHQGHHVLDVLALDDAVHVPVGDLCAHSPLELLHGLALPVLVLPGADGHLHVHGVAALAHVVHAGDLVHGAGGDAGEGVLLSLVPVVDADPAHVPEAPEGGQLPVPVLDDGDGLDLELIVFVAVGGDVLGDDADAGELPVLLADGDGEGLRAPGVEAVGLELLVGQDHGALPALGEEELEVELVDGAAVILPDAAARVAGHLHLHGVARPGLQEAQVLHGIREGHVVLEAPPVHVRALHHVRRGDVDGDGLPVLEELGLEHLLRRGEGAVPVRIRVPVPVPAPGEGEDDIPGHVAGDHPVAERLFPGGGDPPPVDAARADAAHGLHRQVLHLPLVDLLAGVAGDADGHVGELLHVLDGQEHAEALAPGVARVPAAGEAVEIAEILRRGGPVTVIVPGVVPEGKLRGLLFVAVHVLVAEAEQDVGDRPGQLGVVGVHRDQVALLPVDGKQAAPLGIGLQGELARRAPGVQPKARDVRSAVILLRHRGEVEAQEGILVPGPQLSPGAVVHRDGQDAGRFAVALGDAPVPQDRGGHLLRRGEPSRGCGCVSPQHRGHVQDLRQIRQRPREGQALPLLPQAGVVLDAAHAALQHGPGRRAADHRQGRVPHAAVDVPVAHLQGQGLAEVARPGDGLGIAALVARGQALQARQILVRQIDAEDHVGGGALDAAAAGVGPQGIAVGPRLAPEAEQGVAAPPADVLEALILKAQLRQEAAAEIDVAVRGIDAVALQALEGVHLIQAEPRAGPLVLPLGGVPAHEGLDLRHALDGPVGHEEELVRMEALEAVRIQGVRRIVAHHRADPVQDGLGRAGLGRHAVADPQGILRGENILGAGIPLLRLVYDAEEFDALAGDPAGGQLQDIGPLRGADVEIGGRSGPDPLRVRALRVGGGLLPFVPPGQPGVDLLDPAGQLRDDLVVRCGVVPGLQLLPVGKQLPGAHPPQPGVVVPRRGVELPAPVPEDAPGLLDGLRHVLVDGTHDLLQGAVGGGIVAGMVGLVEIGHPVSGEQRGEHRVAHAAHVVLLPPLPELLRRLGVDEIVVRLQQAGHDGRGVDLHIRRGRVVDPPPEGVHLREELPLPLEAGEGVEVPRAEHVIQQPGVSLGPPALRQLHQGVVMKDLQRIRALGGVAHGPIRLFPVVIDEQPPEGGLSLLQQAAEQELRAELQARRLGFLQALQGRLGGQPEILLLQPAAAEAQQLPAGLRILPPKAGGEDLFRAEAGPEVAVGLRQIAGSHVPQEFPFRLGQPLVRRELRHGGKGVGPGLPPVFLALLLDLLPVQPGHPGGVGRGLCPAVPLPSHGLRRDAPEIGDPGPAGLPHIAPQLIPEDGGGIPVQILLHGLHGIHELIPAAGKVLYAYGVPVFDTPGPGVEPDIVIGPQAEELEQEHGLVAVRAVGLRHLREVRLQVLIARIPVLLDKGGVDGGILPQPAETVRAGEGGIGQKLVHLRHLLQQLRLVPLQGHVGRLGIEVEELPFRTVDLGFRGTAAIDDPGVHDGLPHGHLFRPEDPPRIQALPQGLELLQAAVLQRIGVGGAHAAPGQVRVAAELPEEAEVELEQELLFQLTLRGAEIRMPRAVYVAAHGIYRLQALPVHEVRIAGILLEEGQNVRPRQTAVAQGPVRLRQGFDQRPLLGGEPRQPLLRELRPGAGGPGKQEGADQRGRQRSQGTQQPSGAAGGSVLHRSCIRRHG